MNLSKDIKITVVKAAAAAAQTELTSDVLDMQGWAGVMFIALTGDVTTGCVLTLTAKGNSANSTSSPTPVTQGSATFTAGDTDADSKVLIVDVYEPQMRYVFASLTRTAANDLGPDGITVNMVSGGLLRTTDASRATPDAVFDLIASMTPLRRVTTPQEFADAVLFFLSPWARAVTGQNLIVDCGLVKG